MIYPNGARARTPHGWGTIVHYGNSRNSHPYSVVLDEVTPGIPHYLPINHELIIPGRSIRFKGIYEDYEPVWNRDALYDIPQELKVVVGGTFIYDGVEFPTGHYGRVIAIEHHDIVTVSWSSLRNDAFRDEAPHRHCYSVPSPNLLWSLYLGGDMLMPPTSNPRYPVGTRLRYTGRPMQVASPKGGHATLPHGCVVSVASCSTKNALITLRGMCSPIALGSQINIPLASLVASEENLLLGGDTVEVRAEISFRKTSLAGKRGKVVLPQDEDGDVGVEFDEYLTAGSLDGEGKQGHCLYIGASALIKTSE